MLFPPVGEGEGGLTFGVSDGDGGGVDGGAWLGGGALDGGDGGGALDGGGATLDGAALGGALVAGGSALLPPQAASSERTIISAKARVIIFFIRIPPKY